MNTVEAQKSTPLAWQTRVAVLWLIQIANYISYIFISTQESISIMQAEPGESGLTLAIFFFVPCFVAWMTFAAQRSLALWLNIIVGAAFALLKLAATILAATGLIARPDGAISPAVIFNEFWAIFAAAFIVIYAWRAKTESMKQ